jgi:hypothetical protein
MNRAYFILYSIILGLIICMCLVYVRMYPSIESFAVFNGKTLTSKYKRKDGRDNTPCHALKFTISKKDLEKWFVGKDGEKPLIFGICESYQIKMWIQGNIQSIG